MRISPNFVNPMNITFQEALTFIDNATACFHENRLSDFSSGFSDNARIRYASFPEMRGSEELQRWLVKRTSRQLHYRMNKRAVAAMGNVICATWEGVWQDSQTKKDMQCRAAEVMWVNELGFVNDWYVAMSVWEQGGEPTTPLL